MDRQTAPTPSTVKVTGSFDELLKQANASLRAGKQAEAAQQYAALTRARPDNVAAWMNLCTALRQQKHLCAAIAAGRRAIALAPDNSGGLTNLGNALMDASHVDEALALQRRAYSLAPSDLLVRRNLAIALRESGHFAEALTHFAALAADAPDDANLGWEQALCMLYMGDYARGWPAFEARWRLPNISARSTQQPEWRGEDFSGKHLLVSEEQGFGDTLLCARYLPRLIALAGENGSVTLACKKPLHRLLSTITGLRLTTPQDAFAQPQAYQLQTAMMCLPGIFKTDLTNIPALPALNDAVDLPPIVSQALAAGNGRLKVGIIWSGSVTFGNNRKRSVSAERFLPFLDVPGVELYSLQKGPCENDLHAFGAEAVIHEIAPHFDDFAHTAAALRQLDLVIMTDSSVAHLAGSLGVPVWNLLHDRPYWLYLQDRNDSPWYASMTLYRQQKPGDWDDVFAQVADDLRTLASAKTGRAK